MQAIVNELQGEKIDIIAWSDNPATFLVNALTPAEVSKVVIDEEKRRIEVVVPTEQLSLAIGRKGQNVRLASKLTGWHVDILTDEEESKRRNEEFTGLTELFTVGLGVEEMLAQLLAAEGFTSIEEIAYIEEDELASIESFDIELAKSLKSRAQNYLDSKNKEFEIKIQSLGIEQELMDILDFSNDQIIKLAEYGIKSIEDLAEIKVKEFIEILPNSNMTYEQIHALIESAKEQSKTQN